MENRTKYLKGENASMVNYMSARQFLKRSNTMNYNLSKMLSGSVLILLTISLIAGLAMGQNLVLNNNSVTNNGVINVKGNINTSGAGGNVALGGTVNLNGTATTQQLGVSGSNAIQFTNLNALGSVAKQMDVNVTVTDALTVNITGGLDVDLQANTLTLGGTSTLTLGSLDVSDAGSTVVYNRNSGSQTILGLAYAGAVTLSGNATKNLGASASVAGTFSHSGGALTVDQDLTVSYATPSFATIADISSGKTLTLSGTGAKTIAAFTNPSGGSLSNSGASGLMTITALNGNSGTISTGAGGATFTNAAVNAGNITGGAGAVTFNNTLAHSAGTITAGSGDITFTGTVTQTGGTITSSDLGSVLNFAGDVDNSGGGTISLTSTGAAEFGGALTAGILSFASGSTVTFDGGAQTIPNTTYGNLTLDGSDNKSAAGSLTLAGNLVLNRDLDVYTNGGTLTFSSAGTVTGSGEVVGAVARTHTLASGTPYAFNRAEVTMEFASNENADVTLTMRPGVAPSGVGANYINRLYGVSSSADLSANNATLKLYYLDGEKVGSITESKLGISKYDGSSLTKLSTNSGSYTRVDGTPANTIALSNVNQGLSGIAQFAIVPVSYYTIAGGAWNTIGTWGYTSDDIPSATDDATIKATHAVTVPVASTIANLTIEATGSLSVDGANFNATSINNAGSLNVSGTRTLTVTGGDLTNSGSITNDGTITVE